MHKERVFTPTLKSIKTISPSRVWGHFTKSFIIVLKETDRKPGNLCVATCFGHGTCPLVPVMTLNSPGGSSAPQ